MAVEAKSDARGTVLAPESCSRRIVSGDFDKYNGNSGNKQPEVSYLIIRLLSQSDVVIIIRLTERMTRLSSHAHRLHLRLFVISSSENPRVAPVIRSPQQEGSIPRRRRWRTE